jgi:amino acid permease
MEKATTTESSMQKDLHPVTTSTSVGLGSVKPKKHFSILGALGVQFSVTGTPLALGTYLSLVIGLGGSAGYFWGFFFAGFLQFMVCLAVAELAAAMPHSSGKLHHTGHVTGVLNYSQVMRNGLSSSHHPHMPEH